METTSVRELPVQPPVATWGYSLAPIGDLDGNGFDDLAIGALVAGIDAVWIAFLGPGGQPIGWFPITNGVGVLGSLSGYDNFGAAVAALGDLGGDGTLEIAVGCPGRDTTWRNEGVVWILSLDATGTPVAAHEIGNGLGGFGGFIHQNDGFGEALAALGDLDGDGTVELAVGVPRDDGPGWDVGRVWILSLASDGTVVREVRVSNGTAGFGRGLVEHDAFGSSLASLGDLNGDGVPDLAVGARGNQGRVWLLFLNPNGTVQSKVSIDAACLPGAATGFGTSLANLGDPEGDGTLVLAVGAPAAGTAAEPGRGAVDLLYLGTGGAVTARQALGDPGGIGFDLGAGSQAGRRLAALPDQNGDGRNELVVATSPNPGKVRVLTLGADLGRYYCTPATPGSTGCPAFLWASGSSVLADQDFRLTATQLPTTPNLGYFLMGTEQATFVPPGSQGALCVTPGMVRLFPTANTTELEGGFARNVALLPEFASNVTPGGTWNFQAWFRDGAGPSNFTDAVSVTFQ